MSQDHKSVPGNQTDDVLVSQLNSIRRELGNTLSSDTGPSTAQCDPVSDVPTHLAIVDNGDTITNQVTQWTRYTALGVSNQRTAEMQLAQIRTQYPQADLVFQIKAAVNADGQPDAYKLWSCVLAHRSNEIEQISGQFNLADTCTLDELIIDLVSINIVLRKQFANVAQVA